MKLAAVDARLDAVRAMLLAPWLVWGRALMGRLLLGTVLVIIAAAGAQAEPLPPGGGGGGFPDPASISYGIAPEAPTAADDIEISITPSSAQTYTGGVVLDIQDADFDFVFQGTMTVNSSPAIFSVGRLPAGDYSAMILFTEDQGMPSTQEFTFSVSTSGEVSSTVILVEPTEIEVDQVVNFTVNVNTPTLPSGTVALSIDGVVLDTVAVDQGQARFKASFENSGSHRIAARYSGDGTYAPSKGALDVTVNGLRADTTVSISSDASPAEYGAPVTLTFTIASTEGTPEGKLDVSLDSNAYTTLDVVGGVATLKLEDLDDGDHAIGAAYLGSAAHRPSQAQNFTQTVKPAPLPKSKLVLTSSPNPSKDGEEVTFTATVTGEQYTPFGQVWFYDGDTTLGVASLSNGVATRKQSLSSGQHQITATYSGGLFYQDSSDTVAQTVNSAGAATTVSISATPSPVYKGDTMTVTVTVSSDAGTPSGDVKLSIGGTVVDTLTLANGVATYSTSTTPLGNFTIEAEYLGTEGFAGSSKSKTHTRKIDGTIVLDSVTPATPAAGDNPVYEVHVELEDQSVALGYIKLEVDGEKLAGETLVGGKASLSVTDLPRGSARFVYTPDDPSTYYYKALTAPKAVKRATTLALTTNPQKPTSGDTVALSVAVNHDHPSKSPSGRVLLYKNNMYLAETTMAQSGGPSFAIENVAAGALSYRVDYLGDDTFASSSADINFTVTAPPAAATTTFVSSTPNPATVGDSLMFTVEVASDTGTPEGEVTLSIGDTEVPLTLIGGNATYTATRLRAGSYDVSASYGGNTSHAASVSSKMTQVIAPAPKDTTVTLALSKANPAVGDVVTVTATITAEGGVPTGYVFFSAGSRPLGGTQPVSDDGRVTSNSSWTVVAGINSFAVDFTPFDDSDYRSSSNTLSVTAVTPTTTSVTSSANPATAGSSVTFTVTVGSATGTPQGAVTLHVGDTEVPLTLDGTGKATHTVSDLDAGSYELTADYAGSESHAQSSSTILTQQVNEPAAGPVATTTSVTSDANPASSTNTTNYTVTVTATEGIPTGNIVLHLGEEAYTITLNREGVATAYEVVASSKQVWAEYIGNDDFAGSKSTPFTQEAKVGVGLAIDAPSYVRVGEDIDIAARVTSNNAATPTGEIVVRSGDAEWRGTLVNGEVVINIGGYGEATLSLYVRYVPDDPKFDEAVAELRIEVDSGDYGPYPTHDAIEQSTLVTTDVITQILSGFDTGEAVNVTLTSPFPFKQSSAYSAYMPDRIAFNSSLFAIQSAAGNKEPGPFNVWVSGKAGIVSSSGADGWFAGGLVGADYMFSPQLTGGLALMFDHTELVDSADTDIVSSGWMAIPYIKGKLSDTLSYQLQIGGGGSTSEITPDGAKYTDSVSAMRLLLSGSLSGSFDVGDFTFAPTASVTYFQQNIAAFTDGLGNDVPGMTAGNGSFSLSPALSRRFKLDDLTLTLGGSVQLSANLKNDDGVWSYDGLRDGAGLNLSLGLPGGATFRASTGVSGVVLGNSFSARGSVGLSAPIY